MEKLNEIRGKFAEGRGWPRWAMILVAAGTAALLMLTLETGKLSAQSPGFRFRGALVRLISPNSDQKNDIGILCFENPKASAVSGTIYNLRGQEVSGMIHIQDPNNTDLTVTECRKKFPPGNINLDNPEALSWDGKSRGRRVSAGVYIYQIQSEDMTVTGTVLVVR